jgi:hypothetical protein
LAISPNRWISSVYSPRLQLASKDFVQKRLKLKPLRKQRADSSLRKRMSVVKASLTTCADSNQTVKVRRAPVNLRYLSLLASSSNMHSRVETPNVMQTPSDLGEPFTFSEESLAGKLKVYYEAEAVNTPIKLPELRPKVPERKALGRELPKLTQPYRCESPISKKEMLTTFDLDKVPALEQCNY